MTTRKEMQQAVLRDRHAVLGGRGTEQDRRDEAEIAKSCDAVIRRLEQTERLEKFAVAIAIAVAVGVVVGLAAVGFIDACKVIAYLSRQGGMR